MMRSHTPSSRIPWSPRMCLVPLLVLCALVGCEGGPAAKSQSSRNGVWTKLPNVRDAAEDGLHELSAEKVDSTIIIVGGASYRAAKVGGLRYNLSAQRWLGLPAAPISWRVDYASGKVQNQVVIWGGTSDRGLLRDGASYQLATNRWRRLPTSPLRPRYGHTAVSTGRTLIFFGGATTPRLADPSSNTGGTYTPGREGWRRIPRAPITGRRGHVAVWSGDEMIVWGGHAVERGGVPQRFFSDGAAFDPKGNRWRRIARAPFRATEDSFGVWAGDALFVFDGTRAALYDPRSNVWTSAGPPPNTGVAYGGVWNGKHVLMWGPDSNTGVTSAAAYNPSRNIWVSLPRGPLSARRNHVRLWTGRSLFLWGGCCKANSEHSDGAEYRPSWRH